MSNETKTEQEQLEQVEQPVKLVPIDEIKPFFLTPKAHQRVHDGKPDYHIPKEAIPYLLMETRFGLPASEVGDGRRTSSSRLVVEKNAPTVRIRKGSSGSTLGWRRGSASTGW